MASDGREICSSAIRRAFAGRRMFSASRAHAVSGFNLDISLLLFPGRHGPAASQRWADALHHIAKCRWDPRDPSLRDHPVNERPQRARAGSKARTKVPLLPKAARNPRQTPRRARAVSKLCYPHKSTKDACIQRIGEVEAKIAASTEEQCGNAGNMVQSLVLSISNVGYVCGRFCRACRLLTPSMLICRACIAFGAIQTTFGAI